MCVGGLFSIFVKDLEHKRWGYLPFLDIKKKNSFQGPTTYVNQLYF